MHAKRAIACDAEWTRFPRPSMMQKCILIVCFLTMSFYMNSIAIFTQTLPSSQTFFSYKQFAYRSLQSLKPAARNLYPSPSLCQDMKYDTGVCIYCFISRPARFLHLLYACYIFFFLAAGCRMCTTTTLVCSYKIDSDSLTNIIILLLSKRSAHVLCFLYAAVPNYRSQ